MGFGFDPFGIDIDTFSAPKDLLKKKKLKRLWDEVNPQPIWDQAKNTLDSISGAKEAVSLLAPRKPSMPRLSDFGRLGGGLSAGLGATLDVIETQRGLQNRGTSPRSPFGTNVIGRGQPDIGGTLATSLSGERTLDEMFPGKEFGSRLGQGIESNTGILGRPLRAAFDTALAPSTALTVGAGPALSGAIKGTPQLGRLAGPLSSLAAPAGSGNVAKRLLGESGMGFGAVAGADIADTIATEYGAPGWSRGPIRLAGNLVGAGLAGKTSELYGGPNRPGDPDIMAARINEPDENIAKNIDEEIQARRRAAEQAFNEGVMKPAQAEYNQSLGKTPTGRESMRGMRTQKRADEINQLEEMVNQGKQDLTPVDPDEIAFGPRGTMSGMEEDPRLKSTENIPEAEEMGQLLRQTEEFEDYARNVAVTDEDPISPEDLKLINKLRARLGKPPHPDTPPEDLPHIGGGAEPFFTPPSRGAAQGYLFGDAALQGATPNPQGRFSDPLPTAAERFDAAGRMQVPDRPYAPPFPRAGDPLEGAQPVSGQFKTPPQVPPTPIQKLPKNKEELITFAKMVDENISKRPSTRAIRHINSIFKGMWASLDGSFIGIQGLPLLYMDPKAAKTFMSQGFKSLLDPAVYDEYLKAYDADMIAKGLQPSGAQQVKGLHLAGKKGIGTDVAEAVNIPVLKQSNRMFAIMGDVARLERSKHLQQMAKSGKRSQLFGLAGKKYQLDDDTLTSIVNASNRATGYAKRPFGGTVGELALFAPRFLQSQLETILKAGTDFKTLEGGEARKQMLAMIGFGVGITILANEALENASVADPTDDDFLDPKKLKFGGDTVFDPSDSNFMRIRNVPGLGDVSVFGPWDSLVKGIVATAGVDLDKPIEDWRPDLDYFARSKASPIVSAGWDFLTGTDFKGDEIKRDPISMARRIFLPFGVREIGEEPIGKTALGLTGFKSTPLTEREKLDRKLDSAGIKKSDPDYDIKKRDYLRDHPEDIPKASKAEFKRASEISAKHREQEAKNDTLTTSNEQTLTEFRENRKIINRDRRILLEEVVGDFNGNPKTKQQKWIDSYYQLFDEAIDEDSPTGDIDPDKFDQLVLDWMAQEGNGKAALDYINRFTLSGQTQVEQSYIKDLQTLNEAGYFDTPRYRNLRSDLSDEEIDKYRDRVSSARAGDQKLAEAEFSIAAKRVLPEYGLTDEEITDVIKAGFKRNQSPEYIRLKNLYHKELMWFNPNAYWRDYQVSGSVTERKKSSSLLPSRGGSRSRRGLSRSLGR